jgi:hypothetical protein
MKERGIPMIRATTTFDLERLLLVLGILGTIVGVFHVGPWAEQERDALARFMGPPLNVRFIGTLHPPDHEGKRGSRTLKVSWDDQNWKLEVEKLVVLTASVSEMRILQALRPYSLRFTGPEEVLGVISASDLVGKPLTVSGYLYINHHRLMVSSIDSVSEEGGEVTISVTR